MAKKRGMLPKHELEALAEVFFPTMKNYLSSPEGKAAFEEWRAQQEEPQEGKRSDNKNSNRGIT